MQVRNLLIAVALLACLGGLVWWSNKAQKEKEGKPDPAASPKIVEIPSDQIKQIELVKAGQPATVLVRESGNYRITAPKPLRADQDAASSVATALASLLSDRLVEEKATDFSPYGLNSPTIAVKVSKTDGKDVTLLIGDETPTGSAAFCRLGGDARVFTIASYNKSSFDKTWKDLQDKRLLTFDSDKLTRLQLTAKGQAIEFGKNNQNEWQIIAPRPLRADGGAVEELIRKIKDAKMDPSLADDEVKKIAAGWGGASPVATVTVTDAAGTHQLDVRKSKDNTYYAKGTAAEGVHKATTDLGDGLNKSLDDFRNKKIFDFGWSDPTKLSFKDSKANLVIDKSGDKWMAAGKEMDSVTVRNLIDKLRDLASIKFPDQGTPPADIELTVTSNEGKRVEKVRIGKSGDRHLAARENEPSVYELDGKAVEELQKAAADVKAPQPPKKDAAKK